MRSERYLPYLFFFGLICLALSGAGVLQSHFGGAANGRGNPALAALLAAYATSTPALDAQTRTSPCAAKGPLPDPSCSPGEVFADATAEHICTPGYSANVRNVSVSTKKKIYKAYGMSYPQPTGSYEIDHLVPLELGGDNSTANLFPEAAEPQPGFHEKDVVEDYLHQEVCAGRVGLAAAQYQIATNWLAVYQTLSPDLIAQIKSKFRNWAD